MIAIAIPTSTLIGILYSIHILTDSMSLTSAILGYSICLAMIGMTARASLVGAMLQKDPFAVSMRIYTSLTVLTVLVLGLIFVDRFERASAQNLFGLFVMLVCWSAFVLVGFATHSYHLLNKERLALEQRLAYLANHDSLTGLANRRYFFQQFERALETAKKNGTRIALLIVDADHFKDINDIAGHSIGDEALRSIAQSINAATRASDVVGRVGGEEFAVLINSLPSDEIPTQIADQIRQRVESAAVDGWTADHGPITVSVGIAVLEQGDTTQSLFEAADTALYAAKDAGRNRTSQGTCGQRRNRDA